MGDYTQHPPSKRQKRGTVLIEYRKRGTELATATLVNAADVPPELRSYIETAGLLSIQASLNYTIKLNPSPGPSQPAMQVIGDGSIGNETLIACNLERHDRHQFDVYDFFTESVEPSQVAVIRGELRRGVVPRTVGGWGMEVAGAAGRFFALKLGLETLPIIAVDGWRVRNPGARADTRSIELRNDPAVRRAYVEARHARLGVPAAELNKRIKSSGFYGTWGFTPQGVGDLESDHSLGLPIMEATVSASPELETLLRTQARL